MKVAQHKVKHVYGMVVGEFIQLWQSDVPVTEICAALSSSSGREVTRAMLFVAKAQLVRKNGIELKNRASIERRVFGDNTELIRDWNSSDSVEAFAMKHKVTTAQAYGWAGNLRQKGLKLKKFKHHPQGNVKFESTINLCITEMQRLRILETARRKGLSVSDFVRQTLDAATQSTTLPKT